MPFDDIPSGRGAELHWVLLEPRLLSCRTTAGLFRAVPTTHRDLARTEKNCRAIAAITTPGRGVKPQWVPSSVSSLHILRVFCRRYSRRSGIARRRLRRECSSSCFYARAFTLLRLLCFYTLTFLRSRLYCIGANDHACADDAYAYYRHVRITPAERAQTIIRHDDY